MVNRLNASPWGWIAIGATVVSLVGYAIQTMLDYVAEPPIIGFTDFYGVFGGFAGVALLAGTVSVVTGWRRSKHAVTLGLAAIAYVALAQVAQSLWD